MKSGWVTKKLGEVCEFRRGLTYSKHDEVARSDNVVLRANNISLETQSLCFDEFKYIRSDFEIPKDKFIEKDCLLICTASGSKEHLGKVAYIDDDYKYAFGGFMGLIVPDRSEILPRYFYWLLTSDSYRKFIRNLTDGANINNLKFSQLSGFDIPIAPLAEQKRIVAKIDAAFEKIDALKANAEKNLANAKELFQSALDEAMRPKKGWVEKRLGEVAAIRVGPFGSSLHKSDYVTDGVPLVNPCHMKDSRIAANIATKVSEEKAESLKDYRLKAGDIVFARRGEIGRLAFVSEKEDGFLCGTGSLFARFKERYEVRFLYFLFSSNSFVGRLEQLSTGTTMKSINSSALESMSFSTPTIVEQKRLANEMELLSSKLETLQRNYAQQIADCVEMRQAILREAFEGRL